MKVGAIARLAAGWQRFQSSHHPSRKHHYSALSAVQDPKVLFITRADSRMEPNLIFQSEPGQMFVARNPDNIVPPLGALLGGASASLQYALTALSVTDIIVCGCSDCAGLARRNLNLLTWFYDIPSGAVTCFESESRAFLPLSSSTKPAFDRAEALVHE